MLKLFSSSGSSKKGVNNDSFSTVDFDRILGMTDNKQTLFKRSTKLDDVSFQFKENKSDIENDLVTDSNSPSSGKH